jgi:hypothetical protein
MGSIISLLAPVTDQNQSYVEPICNDFLLRARMYDADYRELKERSIFQAVEKLMLDSQHQLTILEGELLAYIVYVNDKACNLNDRASSSEPH